jgi:hypothetical protein
MGTKARLFTRLLVLTLAVFVMGANKGSKSIGVVALVDGDVWRISGQSGGNAQKEFLENNSKVFEGDKIITSENGYIKILMNDDTVFDLGGASKFTFEQFKMKTKADRKAKYKLGYGQMRSIFTVKSKTKDALQVKTPDVVMGIRGTEFLTEKRSAKTQVVLLEGSLEVSSLANKKTIKLEPGKIFDSSKISKDSFNIGSLNNAQMQQLQIKDISSRGAFINNAVGGGSKSKKSSFPVSTEMKKEMADKPKKDMRKQMQDSKQKSNIRGENRLNPAQRAQMRQAFQDRLDKIRDARTGTIDGSNSFGNIPRDDGDSSSAGDGDPTSGGASSDPK